jgi:hypothetical protein
MRLVANAAYTVKVGKIYKYKMENQKRRGNI